MVVTVTVLPTGAGDWAATVEHRSFPPGRRPLPQSPLCWPSDSGDACPALRRERAASRVAHLGSGEPPSRLCRVGGLSGPPSTSRRVSIASFRGTPVTFGIGCRKQGGQPRDGNAVCFWRQQRSAKPNKLFYTFQLPILARRCSAVKQNAVFFSTIPRDLLCRSKSVNLSSTVTYNNRFFFSPFGTFFSLDIIIRPV